MFNSQSYYFKEQQANFKAVSSRQVQDRNHCDTINCFNDTGVKVYVRNIVNRDIVEMKLCRECRVRPHLFFSMPKFFNSQQQQRQHQKKKVRYSY